MCLKVINGFERIIRMDIKAGVIEIFEEVLDTDEIRENQDLDLFENELLDSLAIIEVLLAIEDKFDLSLQPTDLERDDMSSVNKLTDFLERKL
ncbi:D-alanine--poly(phosphoribitol) ligase subunit 2 [Peptostreptococcus sp. D1]|nr:D-alanine--poly(phosphoribitol) ligase subunit 2 [Peptostreptococcus sp. D1]